VPYVHLASTAPMTRAMAEISRKCELANSKASFAGVRIAISSIMGWHRSSPPTAISGSKCISADRLRGAVLQSRSLERALLGFAHSFMTQTANTALSNGTSTLEERLARWLLKANDRLRGDEIPLTHEFLSLMLGVRRAGVTVGLHYLEQRGLIRLARKQIIITDRAGLKTAANGTYHQPEKSTALR
jgi:hypothetical protein